MTPPSERRVTVLAEFRQHFRGEQLEGFADMLMAAGLIEQDDLIDVRGAETPQFSSDGFRRSDQAASQCRFLSLRILALPFDIFAPKAGSIFG
jgi:hypothetical protein